jgi:myo-inositol-1(or 4)-monophosphatase
MPYENELSVALEAAREAGAILRRHLEEGTKTWEKSEDNPVTLADLEADKAIATRLGEAFPGDAILSEETIREDNRLQKSRVWIVDPMDGTKEFTKRIPEFSVSIALTEDGEPIVGAIYNPMADIAVYATRGGGTFRNGEPATVSSCEQLSDCEVIASRTEISRDQFAPYEGWFKNLRPLGSIAWKLACTACGDGDINISVAPKNEWDVCAGDLLVREAGGIYVDFDGEIRRYNQPKTLIDRGMAAGPKPLLDQFFQRHHKMT